MRTRSPYAEDVARDEAPNRGRVPESLRRNVQMKWIVGLGLAASFLLAPGVWLERPFFTPIPVFASFRPLPPPLDLVVLAALLLLLGAILVAKRPRRLIFLWVLLLALRMLWDRATWQPFVLMYAFLLLTTAFADWNGRSGSRDWNAAACNTARFVVVAIYVWSGFSKLSFGFVHFVLPELLLAAGITLPSDVIVRAGLLVPLAEIVVGLGLLLSRTRTVCLVAAIFMHAFVLLAIGPLGQNYNAIVWPWNVAMIAALVVLFGDARRVRPADILINRGVGLHLAALTIFGVLPGLSYLGLWPTYLSYRLYSDQYYWATISMTPAVHRKLPPRSREKMASGEDYGGYDGHLNVAYWSELELGAILPPEPVVFAEVARRVCTLAEDPFDVRLIVTAPPDRWSGEETRVTTYCDQR